MKIFIDTANLDEIKKYAEYGIVDGVTTNPSLVAKEGDISHEQRIKEICEIIDGPVSAEVLATEYEEMLKEGRMLAGWHENVVVKLPTIRDGLRACKTLSDEGIKVNMTLVFSPSQALFCAKAGATFISPFIGRLDDISEPGMELIEEIVDILSNYDYKAEVLTASVRHPRHVVEAAKIGSDIATIPFDVLDKMFNHPLTDRGLEKFLKDAKKNK
ncbi:fructose-6-phosphate aldolase [Candidatus Peregrinibacteria bacterium]|nr:fructose-6-phosphate aldolase [Candidatus Peregrinibacteria bacterium]